MNLTKWLYIFIVWIFLMGVFIGTILHDLFLIGDSVGFLVLVLVGFLFIFIILGKIHKIIIKLK